MAQGESEWQRHDLRQRSLALSAAMAGNVRLRRALLVPTGPGRAAQEVAKLRVIQAEEFHAAARLRQTRAAVQVD